MQNRHVSAAADRTAIAILVACTTFVVGYTAVRMSLGQNNIQPDFQADVQQTVIPHEAALWSAVGQNPGQ